MAGASNDGGEDSPGGIISGETGFAHTGAVVNDESGNFLLIHGVERLLQEKKIPIKTVQKIAWELDSSSKFAISA